MSRLQKFLSAAATLAFAVLSAMTACAHNPPLTQTTVEIFDRIEGRVLPTYWHEGRRYVVGKPGNEYSIRVRNGSTGRVLAVMSVDGVNVITGDTASSRQSSLNPSDAAYPYFCGSSWNRSKHEYRSLALAAASGSTVSRYPTTAAIDAKRL